MVDLDYYLPLWYNSKNKHYIMDLDFYSSILNKETPVIEFGSGTGRVSLHLINEGFEVYGVEKNEHFKKFLALQLALLNYEEFFITKFEKLNYIFTKFQIILPFNFLLYLTSEELCVFFYKLSVLNFTLIAFDIDNIISKPSINEFSDTSFYIKANMRGYEKIDLNKNSISIGEYICQNQIKMKINSFHLYLHQIQSVRSTLQKYFGIINEFGDFNKCEYYLGAQKYICILKKTMR